MPGTLESREPPPTWRLPRGKGSGGPPNKRPQRSLTKCNVPSVCRS
nr:MAG TPA: hypothetical protein [Caudoviricetes sp.]